MTAGPLNGAAFICGGQAPCAVPELQQGQLKAMMVSSDEQEQAGAGDEHPSEDKQTTNKPLINGFIPFIHE